MLKLTLLLKLTVVDRATVANDKYKAEVTVETHFEAAAALDPAD